MRILLPFDFSDYSVNAYDYAINLASKLGASLEVFNVFDLPQDSGSHTAQEWLELQADLATKRIDEMRNILLGDGDTLSDEAKNLDIDFSADVGQPHKVLVDKVNDGEYTYVVMGTKGKNANTSSEPFGSVTIYVMDRIETPLLAIPLTANYKNFDNILIAEDLDQDDELPLKMVFDIADQFDSRIAILHISELKDYDNITRQRNYSKIKHNYARERQNLEYIFERGMNHKVDTLENVAKNKNSDVLVLICRDYKRGFQGMNGLTKAAIAQLDIPILTFHTEKK